MKLNPATGRVERTAADKARHQRVREGLQFDRRPTRQEVNTQFDAIQRHEQLRDQVRHLVQALRAERHRRGMSLEELANHTGWDQAQVARLENEEDTITSFDTLVQWARALDKKVQLDLVDAA